MHDFRRTFVSRSLSAGTDISLVATQVGHESLTTTRCYDRRGGRDQEALINVWRLIAHHDDPEKAILWSQQRSRIAIGWGWIGDLRLAAPEDPAAIALMIREARPDLHNSHLGGPSLWRFYSEMAIGDLVILGDGHQRRAVVRITGDYDWVDRPDPDLPGQYFHQRPVRITSDDPNDLWDRSGAGPARGESIRWTLVRCAKR